MFGRPELLSGPDVPDLVVVPLFFVAFVDRGDVGGDGDIAACHDINDFCPLTVVLEQLEVEVEVEVGEAVEVVIAVAVGG